ncbi:hypothetical protein [Clostridium sp.]|uniref:hypothetical protein n=1 Tax=Clostridium sp. TaxID=1506 RepID=UPI00261D84DA|nr:hypothetical protein [Clostridium sp.]
MKYKRHLISLILLMLMVAFAEYTGEMEVIFPEVGALVVGAWIVEKQPWKVSKIELVTLMTLCSIVGVVIVRYVHFQLTFQVLIGLIFAGCTLKLTKTTLVPIVSACILPILLRTETIVYPISVFVLTLMIVSVQYFINKDKIKDIKEEAKEEFKLMEKDTQYRKKELIKMGKIFIIVGSLTFLSVKLKETLLIAPPLIVAFIELTNEKCKFRKKSKKLLLLFIIASLIGTGFRLGLNEMLGLPLWISTLGTVVSIFICFEKFNMYFPPVAAISILPMLLKNNQILFYPLQVAIGCAIFILIATFLFTEKSIKICNEEGCHKTSLRV